MTLNCGQGRMVDVNSKHLYSAFYLLDPVLSALCTLIYLILTLGL